MPYFLAIDKEEQMALVLALYILEQLDPHPPKKIKVLRFIKARDLITFYVSTKRYEITEKPNG